MNYASLLASIQALTENDEAAFVTEIPKMVVRAEEKILRKAQLPFFRKNQTATATTGNPYLTAPTDFIAPYSLAVTTGGYAYLDMKDVSMIREAFPDITATAQPRLYAMFTETSFILGPVPDSNYTIELHYFYKPETIVTASTTWIGDNAENALLFGTLVEAAIWMQSEKDIMDAYVASFQDAMGDLKVVAEGYSKTDRYRSGEVKTQRR